MGFFSQASLLRKVEKSGPVEVLQPYELDNFYTDRIRKHKASIIAVLVDDTNIEVHKTRFSIEDTEEVLNMRLGGYYKVKII